MTKTYNQTIRLIKRIKIELLNFTDFCMEKRYSYSHLKDDMIFIKTQCVSTCVLRDGLQYVQRILKICDMQNVRQTISRLGT